MQGFGKIYGDLDMPDFHVLISVLEIWHIFK
jgi:hypothetical protein